MAKLGCAYCDGGPEPGFLWTDNNGPIVSGPVCNFEYDSPKAVRQREFEKAQRTRSPQVTKP